MSTYLLNGLFVLILAGLTSCGGGKVEEEIASGTEEQLPDGSEAQVLNEGLSKALKEAGLDADVVEELLAEAVYKPKQSIKENLERIGPKLMNKLNVLSLDSDKQAAARVVLMDALVGFYGQFSVDHKAGEVGEVLAVIYSSLVDGTIASTQFTDEERTAVLIDLTSSLYAGAEEQFGEQDEAAVYVGQIALSVTEHFGSIEASDALMSQYVASVIQSLAPANAAIGADVAIHTGAASELVTEDNAVAVMTETIVELETLLRESEAATKEDAVVAREIMKKNIDYLLNEGLISASEASDLEAVAAQERSTTDAEKPDFVFTEDTSETTGTADDSVDSDDSDDSDDEVVDTDGDGIPDESDDCPLSSDNEIVIRYADANGDGQYTASTSALCPDDDYQYVAGDLSDYELANLQDVSADEDTSNNDTDGDGIPNSSDQCPGQDDGDFGVQYRDDNGDGKYFPSASTMCAGDPSFPFTPNQVSQYSKDNPQSESDDQAAASSEAYCATTTDEATLGVDFNQDGDETDTDTICVIHTPTGYLDLVANCSGGVTTACNTMVKIVSDLDFGELDGTASDEGAAGDGKYTITTYSKLLGSGASGSQYYNSYFDGSGRTFKNIEINVPGSDNVGFIAHSYGNSYSNETIFRNFTLEADVTGGAKVGGILGHMEQAHGTLMINLRFKGTVTGSGASVGGIVGYARGSGSLVNVHNEGAIDGASDVGGIVGEASAGVRVYTSSNTGSITGTGSEVGGIAGDLGDDDAYMRENWNTGDVHGDQRVGGIVGYCDYKCHMQNNYNMGTVLADTNYVGGIVGYIFNNAGNEVKWNYNLGQVLGGASNYSHPIVAYPYSPSSSTSYALADNFFLEDQIDTDHDDDVDGDDDDSSPERHDAGKYNRQTAAELMNEATFTNFDFTSSICSTGYEVGGTTPVSEGNCPARGGVWDKIWTIDEGASCPYLVKNPPKDKPCGTP